YSYTDGKGTDRYNKELSERRAQAVIDYLINVGGIEPDRMIAKGLGKTNPAQPNTTASGADNPLGRQMNRRTEFRIVTDVPTRRVIFNSAEPGSIDQLQKFLLMDENMNVDTGGTDFDDESDFGNPGSRVNLSSTQILLVTAGIYTSRYYFE